MANQMIALGVRGPQLPNLGAAAAQMGNVMANMAIAKEKQAGIERQNAFRQLVSSPQFDPSNIEHIKAAQSLDPAGAEKIITGYASRDKAQLERLGEQTKQFRDILTTIDPADKESYAQFRTDVVSAVPGWGKFLPAPEQWNADTRLRILMKADDVINKTIPTPSASAQQDASGNFYGVTVGGMNPPTAVPVEQMQMGGKGGPMEPAPAAATPIAAAPMMPGANTPARDLLQNLASVRNDEEYQTILSVLDRADPTMAQQLRSAAPRFDPQVLRQIVNEGAQAIGGADMAAIDNALVSGERGGAGGPYVSTGMQFRGKSPMQSPLPGSAQVPLSRIAAEKRAEAQAQKDVDLAAEQAKKLPGKKQVSTILGKMRDAYEQLEKAEAIPSEKRGTIANALDYIGSSALGREAQKFVGTEQSKYLSRIVNMRKALATAIKNATGMSAQEMNSNVELQLTLDTLTDPTQGIEAARMALADLEELYGLPKAAAPARAGRGQSAPNRTKSGASVSDW